MADAPNRRRPPQEQSERNSEIVARVLREGPSTSLTSIATEYGLTRARVQAIVGRAGISVRELKRAAEGPKLATCQKCGGQYERGHYPEHAAAAGHRRLDPPGEKVERNAEVVRLYSDGHNTTEIAEHFGVPQPVITHLLKRAGVPVIGRRRRKGGLSNEVGAGTPLEPAGRIADPTDEAARSSNDSARTPDAMRDDDRPAVIPRRIVHARNDVDAKLAFVEELRKEGFAARVTRDPADITAEKDGRRWFFEIKKTSQAESYFGAATLSEWEAALEHSDSYFFVTAQLRREGWVFHRYTADEFMAFSTIPPFKIFFQIPVGADRAVFADRPTRSVRLNSERVAEMSALFRRWREQRQ